MNNHKNISASIPDWSRESKPFGVWDPGKALLKSIRNYQAWKLSPILKFFSPWAVIRHRFWSAVAGADIPLNCQLGGGLLIPHPNGIVILPAAIIGVNCLIFQQVTIGSNGHGKGEPVVGGHVDIGAGAKILGGVVIGDHVLIGANAVVISDVPSGAVAAGVPAKVL